MRTLGALVVSCVALSACSQAELTPATKPPTGNACSTAPVAFCDAAAPPRCFGDPDSAVPGLTRISPDAGYPLDCTVQLIDPQPGPDGRCDNATACSCLSGIDDSGVTIAVWSCGQ